MSISQILTWTPERVWGPAARGSVLDVDPVAPWMSGLVGSPSVLEHDGRVQMFFVGTEIVSGGESRSSIGLAESLDGLRFHVVHHAEPVLAPGDPGRFDSQSVSHPHVLAVDTGGRTDLWMYYVGDDGTRGQKNTRVQRVGLARSRDGLVWEREPAPLVDIGGPGEIDASQAASPFVLRRDGRFLMWYGAYDGDHRIAFATSADGVHWAKQGAVRGLRGGAAGELGPSVYFDGRAYLIFYNSVEGNVWRLYAATSADGVNWSPAYGGRPVIGDAPAWSFAAAGSGRNSAVHLSQIIERPRELLAYYAGEDASTQRIGAIHLRPAVSGEGTFLGTHTGAPPGPWFDPSWRTRQLLTFGGAGDDRLRDFPILVDGALAAPEFWTVVEDPARDLRFADYTGRPLAFDVELFDRERRRMAIWVRASEVSDWPGNRIYLYFGRTGPPAPVPPGVWDASFAAVWHGERRGTPAPDGRIGPGIGGPGDPADRTIDWHPGTADWTVELWIRPGELKGRNFGILQIGDASAFHLYLHHDNFLVLERFVGAARSEIGFPEVHPLSGVWTHLALTGRDDVVSLFVNGERATWRREPFRAPVDAERVAYLGRGPHGTLDGALDEVRISRVARSAEWIRMSYLAQSGRLLQTGGIERVTSAR